MSVSQLIASFGYLAVFVLVGAESLGVPLPGETALVTAAIYAGHTHRLSPWLIFAVAPAASGQRAKPEDRQVPVRPARRQGGVPRPVRVGAADLRRLPGWCQPDALAPFLHRQRFRRHHLG